MASNGGMSWWRGADGNIHAQIQGVGYKNLGRATDNNGRMVTASAFTPDQAWWYDGVLDPSQEISDPAGGPASSNADIGYSSGSGSGGGGTTGAERSAIQGERDSRMSFLDSLYNALSGWETQANDDITREADTSLANLTTQRDQAYGNLDREQSKLDTQRAKSLNTLGSDIRQLIQGTNNQLGMYGAGNSSAAEMLGVGAANLQNNATGDIDDQYNEQTGDVSLNRANYGKEYDNKLRELNDWTQGAKNNVKRQFAEERNDIDSQRINTENSYRTALAGAGIMSPGSTETIGQASERVKDRLSDTTKANITPGEFTKYTADGVNKADVSGSVKSPILSSGQVMEVLNPRRKKESYWGA